MTVWDTSTPVGTENIRQGDDRIRELKLALADIFGTEGIFPGANPLTLPLFRWKPRRGTTSTRPAVDAVNPGSLYLNTDNNSIQRDNGVTWDDVTVPIPSGTVMVFFQAAAPTGWTQVTTQNDRALRVVSAAGGGTGGTNAVSAGLSHSHTVTAHTHTIGSDGSHSHTVNAHTHTSAAHSHSVAGGSFGTGGDSTSGHMIVSDGGGAPPANTTYASNAGITSGTTTPGATGSSSPGTDSQGSHSHTGATGSASPGTDTQAPTIQYIDVIICSKN